MLIIDITFSTFGLWDQWNMDGYKISQSWQLHKLHKLHTKFCTKMILVINLHKTA